MEQLEHYKPVWTKLPKGEIARLDSELRSIVRAAQRELIRMNVIERPEDADWMLQDANVALHSGNFDRIEVELATDVWYAAMTVQAKVEALRAGRLSGEIRHRGHIHKRERESRYPSYSAMGHFCFLLWLDGLTYAEIADVLGEPANVTDKNSDAWKVAREQARRAIQQRVRRFREENPEA